MPDYQACVIYTAQDNYIIRGATTIEEAARLAEEHFNEGLPEQVTISSPHFVELGMTWRRLKYVGTIQELATGVVHTLHTADEEEEE